MRVDNKNFYFDIGQNNRGVYMRMSEVGYGWTFFSRGREPEKVHNCTTTLESAVHTMLGWVMCGKRKKENYFDLFKCNYRHVHAWEA